MESVRVPSLQCNQSILGGSMFARLAYLVGMPPKVQCRSHHLALPLRLGCPRLLGVGSPDSCRDKEEAEVKAVKALTSNVELLDTSQDQSTASKCEYCAISKDT